MSPERRALVLTLGFLSFAAAYNGLVMDPVLEQIAREFGASTGTAGLVVAYGDLEVVPLRSPSTASEPSIVGQPLPARCAYLL